MSLIEFITIVIGIAFGCLSTAWLTRRFHLRKPNFQKVFIPAMAGLVFVIAGDFIYGSFWLRASTHYGDIPAYFLATLAFGILGVADDLAGDRTVGGFRGHFQALRRGKFTTGAAKAIGGGIAAIGIAALLYAPHWWQVFLAAALIALSANTLNLLDLRPGRCLFGFFVGVLVVTGVLWHYQQYQVGFFLYIAAAIAAILYPLDRSGQLMLGDTGSNAFGAVLGVASALILPPWMQVSAILIMLTFQIWCERYSFSKTIESNVLLRGLDRKIGIR